MHRSGLLLVNVSGSPPLKSIESCMCSKAAMLTRDDTRRRKILHLVANRSHFQACARTLVCQNLQLRLVCLKGVWSVLDVMSDLEFSVERDDYRKHT